MGSGVVIVLKETQMNIKIYVKQFDSDSVHICLTKTILYQWPVF